MPSTSNILNRLRQSVRRGRKKFERQQPQQAQGEEAQEATSSEGQKEPQPEPPSQPQSQPHSESHSEPQTDQQSLNPFRPQLGTLENPPPLKNLTSILSLTPLPTLVVDPSYRIVEVSKSHTTFTGLARYEMLDANLFKVNPRNVPAPNAETLRRAIDDAIRDKVPASILDIDCLNRPNPCDLRIMPVFDDENDTLLYIVLEVSQASRTRYRKPVVRTAGLDATEDTYRDLVDSVRDCSIIMLDIHGNVVTWNDGAQALHGYTPEEIVGKHFSVFYSEADIQRKKPEKELEKCLEEGRLEDEGWRFRKNGEGFWANVVMAPVMRNYTHVGFSKVIRDLIERKEMEARLMEAYEEFAQLKMELESEKSKDKEKNKEAEGDVNGELALGEDAMEQIMAMAVHKSILVVEDDRVTQAFMLRQFKHLGFDNVDSAFNGQQAVGLVRRKPFTYHAILMDIDMPVMDGIEATDVIRNNLKLDVPIIAVTANSEGEDPYALYTAKGMNGYLAKPATKERLAQALLKVLK